jgi:hypothetical protein
MLLSHRCFSLIEGKAGGLPSLFFKKDEQRSSLGRHHLRGAVAQVVRAHA